MVVMGMIIGRSLTPLNYSRTLRASADVRRSAAVTTTRAEKVQNVRGDSSALRGEPFVVTESIAVQATTFYAFFSASTAGVLAYRTAQGQPLSQLTWLDRSGKTVATAGEPARFVNVGLSGDGRRAAAARRTDGPPPNVDVWPPSVTFVGLPLD